MCSARSTLASPSSRSSSEALAPTIAQKSIHLARRAGVPTLRVTSDEFRSLYATDRASGVGAVLAQHWSMLDDADPGVGLCWVAVGLARSPGNLGSVPRTAEAAGTAGIIVLDAATDPFDSGAVRASMGGIFGLRLVRATHEEVSAWAQRNACSVVGMSPHGAGTHTRIDAGAPTVIFMSLSTPRRCLERIPTLPMDVPNLLRTIRCQILRGWSGTSSRSLARL